MVAMGIRQRFPNRVRYRPLRLWEVSPTVGKLTRCGVAPAALMPEAIRFAMAWVSDLFIEIDNVG